MLRLSAAACLLFPTASALAQVVEQTIQISPGPGVGPMQFPGVGGPRQTRTGSGRIRGRVLASDGGPIRRAQVRISGNDIAPKVALTDADGRYDFRDLPSGRFTLQATKSGFVTTQFGQTRPFESGRPIELAEKQQLDNADVNMPRGGVISGRIVDEFGDAIPDVAVTAMRQTWSNGRRRLTASPGRIAPTNDLGQYRIYGLPPGDYYVTASLRGGAALDMVEMELMIAASTTSSAGPTASSPRSGYASTYFPGTANAAEAQKISLAPGQEMASADFGLIAVRLARITGLVLGSDGKPLEGAAVSAMPAGGREGALLLGTNNSRTGRDGTFTLNNVPPGDYTLQARSIQVITSTQGDNLMVFRAASMVGGGESEFGSMPLSVGGEDLSNVLIATGKGATATGQVTFDGPRPASITSIRVTSLAADGDAAPGGGFGAGSVKEDGTFELKGLSGTRLIRVNAPPGWTLKSVKLNGADITDSGAEFKPGEPGSGLEVELTQRVSSIAGSVTSSDGSMLKDYTVVVFAENSDLWRLPMTRWVTGTRPDQDGRFKVQNMPAGNYLAVAVDYIPQGDWGDPEILDRLKSKARRFTLDHGATQTLDLKLTGDY